MYITKLKYRRKLKRMGYNIKGVNDTDVKDIIKLGDMGYTKEEIDKLGAETVNSDYDTQIKALAEKVDALVRQSQAEAVRSTATTETAAAPDAVQAALNILGGGMAEKEAV